VIDHGPGGGYRLQRARPAIAEAAPIAIDLTLVDHAPSMMTLDDAMLQLEVRRAAVRRLPP